MVALTMGTTGSVAPSPERLRQSASNLGDLDTSTSRVSASIGYPGIHDILEQRILSHGTRITTSEQVRIFLSASLIFGMTGGFGLALLAIGFFSALAPIIWQVGALLTISGLGLSIMTMRIYQNGMKQDEGFPLVFNISTGFNDETGIQNAFSFTGTTAPEDMAGLDISGVTTGDTN